MHLVTGSVSNAAGWPPPSVSCSWPPFLSPPTCSGGSLLCGSITSDYLLSEAPPLGNHDLPARVQFPSTASEGSVLLVILPPRLRVQVQTYFFPICFILVHKGIWWLLPELMFPVCFLCARLYANTDVPHGAPSECEGQLCFRRLSGSSGTSHCPSSQGLSRVLRAEPLGWTVVSKGVTRGETVGGFRWSGNLMKSCAKGAYAYFFSKKVHDSSLILNH